MSDQLLIPDGFKGRIPNHGAELGRWLRMNGIGEEVGEYVCFYLTPLEICMQISEFHALCSLLLLGRKNCLRYAGSTHLDHSRGDEISYYGKNSAFFLKKINIF